MSQINTFFASDLHLGHENIITFAPERGTFKHIEHHDEVLIENWNSVVKEDDIVIICGDVVFGKQKNLHKVGRLNGRKKLILGNHDMAWSLKELHEYFVKVYGAMEWKKNSIITHVPVHPAQLNRYAFNIHGHLHMHEVMDGTTPDPLYINVCMEHIGMKPIHKDEVLAIAKKRGLI